MKSRTAIIFLSTLVLAIAGCQSSTSDTPKPVKITCPAGSALKGDPPPDGDEQACWKTENGEDVKDGPMVIYRPGGLLMMQGNYKDGKQDGEGTMYYESGARKSIDNYKDGVQDGDHVSWYENGQIDAKGQYKSGQPDGVWKRWGTDGIRNWEETYKDGKKIS